jgi:hypothetical protein
MFLGISSLRLRNISLAQRNREPGNGLELPIVSSISQLHSGTFALEDASPGLRACIVLPRVRS